MKEAQEGEKQVRDKIFPGGGQSLWDSYAQLLQPAKICCNNLDGG